MFLNHFHPGYPRSVSISVNQTPRALPRAALSCTFHMLSVILHISLALLYWNKKVTSQISQVLATLGHLDFSLPCLLCPSLLSVRASPCSNDDMSRYWDVNIRGLVVERNCTPIGPDIPMYPCPWLIDMEHSMFWGFPNIPWTVILSHVFTLYGTEVFWSPRHPNSPY